MLVEVVAGREPHLVVEQVVELAEQVVVVVQVTVLLELLEP